MSDEKSYRTLTEDQIKTLRVQGCTAQDWNRVLVADGFDPSSVRNAHFLGQVKIGNLAGKVKSVQGLEKPAGIYNATIIDCIIGDQTSIANIGVSLANYDIANNVCIENVATMP